MNFFVTGTDTEVGKTFFTALLVRTLRASGIDAVGFKPVACGGWGDVDALVDAAGGVEDRAALCPIHFAMPASPLTAAFAEERVVEPRKILEAYRALAARHEMVIVEGIGGWLVPLTPDYSVADLACDLGLPVVVVVRNRLGALNHARLTVEHIGFRRLECLGLVLNNVDVPDEPAAHSNRATLERMSVVPVICELMHGQTTLDLSVLRLPGLR